MKVLKSLPYVKAKTISEEKALLIEEIKEKAFNLIVLKNQLVFTEWLYY